MRTKIAHLPGRSCRYLEAGAEDGRIILLIHAFPLSADQWLPQLHRVPPGWRAIAPDLRGFRGTGPAFEDVLPEPPSLDVYAADLVAFMQHLDIARAVIGGLSMGGYVALALARLAPARVAGLVLADTRATADSEDGRAARDRMLRVVEQSGAAGVAAEMMPKLLGATTQRDQPDLADAVRELILANTSSAIAAAVRAMKARPDSTALLATLACPALVICGAEDILTPPADSEAMHAALAGSHLVILPRAGHLSNLEDPLGFNAALGEFLAQVS